MKMKKRRLKAAIIKFEGLFDQLAEVRIENSVATLDESNSFALLTLDEQGRIALSPLCPGFPGVAGTLSSDSEHNLLWLERGRGVYFFDLESQKRGHVITGSDGNARLMQCLLLDAERKLFMLSTISAGCAAIYYIYDLLNDEIRQVGVARAKLFRLAENTLLGAYRKNKGEGSYLEWDTSDFELKSFRGSNNSRLTKELTKLQVDCRHRSKSVHMGRRMLLGCGSVGDELVYYSVRWNEEMDEIKVEPLLLQLPRRALLHRDFTFSADGNWVQTIYTQPNSFPGMVELLVYHASTVYPQGLSMPIYCGYTKEGNEGAFMQHSQWGPLFIERDCDMSDKLFIYRLNDGLELLKEQATDLLST